MEAVLTLEQRADAIRAQRLESTLRNLNDETLMWLALPPAWTLELAYSSGFPTRAPQDLQAFLKEAEAIGLVTSERPRRSDRPENISFWMSDASRPAVINLLLEKHSTDTLQRAIAGIGTRMLNARTADSLPPVLHRWAMLAAQLRFGAGQAATWLDETVLNSIDLNQSGEALGWIKAGEELARILHGPIEDAVVLGNRRLEVAYRRTRDGRMLGSFLERSTAIEAFDELMDLEKSRVAWALHYIGVGGSGKTMILRHITARLAKDRDLAVSRIDFDFLSPEYPAHKPAQLLVQLGEELRAFASPNSKSDDLYRGFENGWRDLDAVISEEGEAKDELAHLYRSEFSSRVARLHRFSPEPRQAGAPDP